MQPARALAAEHSLLTVVEFEELLKVPVSWVYERTRKRGVGRLPGIRLGKYWRFRESDVLGWIERQRVGDGQMLDSIVMHTCPLTQIRGGRASGKETLARPRYQDGSLVVRGNDGKYGSSLEGGRASTWRYGGEDSARRDARAVSSLRARGTCYPPR